MSFIKVEVLAELFYWIAQVYLMKRLVSVYHDGCTGMKCNYLFPLQVLTGLQTVTV